MSNCRCRATISEALTEVALTIGGIVANYAIPDEAVWDLAKALDVIHGRACARCGTQELRVAAGLGDAQHPAIVHLLAQFRRHRAGESAER